MYYKFSWKINEATKWMHAKIVQCINKFIWLHQYDHFSVLKFHLILILLAVSMLKLLFFLLFNKIPFDTCTKKNVKKINNFILFFTIHKILLFCYLHHFFYTIHGLVLEVIGTETMNTFKDDDQIQLLLTILSYK